MASTRNKNCQGDYDLEQKQNTASLDFNTYKTYGQAYTTHFAGDGLLMGYRPAVTLSYNSIDIESQLRGICATNLTGPSFKVDPDYKRMDTLAIADRLPSILPEPLRVDQYQRPLPS
jgi:hypothetical protein